MIDELYFKDDKTTVSIRISKKQWTSAAYENIKKNNYININQNNRFEIVSFISNTKAKQYFIGNKSNNFSNIKRCNISFYDTLIRLVVDNFCSERRTLFPYFLKNKFLI